MKKILSVCVCSVFLLAASPPPFVLVLVPGRSSNKTRHRQTRPPRIKTPHKPDETRTKEIDNHFSSYILQVIRSSIILLDILDSLDSLFFVCLLPCLLAISFVARSLGTVAPSSQTGHRKSRIVTTFTFDFPLNNFSLP